MEDKRFTSIDEENLIDGISGEYFPSLLKFMELTVERMGHSLLNENLDKKSFANLGTQLAEYQGALRLLRLTEKKIRDTTKKALQERK